MIEYVVSLSDAVIFNSMASKFKELQLLSLFDFCNKTGQCSKNNQRQKGSCKVNGVNDVHGSYCYQ